MKLTALLLALLLFATCLSAQENSCLRRVVLFSAIGPDEMPVPGLSTENFRGSFQGAPVRILAATWDTGPRRIVVLVDTSGLMRGRSAWGPSNREKVIEFLVRDALQFTRTTDKVSLVTFSDKVTQQTSLTEDRRQAIAWVEQMAREGPGFFRGKNPFFEALGTAIDILNPHEPGDAIYVITDADNRVRELGLDAIRLRFLSSRVRLFALFLKYRDPSDPQYGAFLQELLIPLGGTFSMILPAPIPRTGSVYDLSEAGQSELRFVTNSVYRQIENFYRVEIELPQAAEKRGSLKLELVGTGDKQTKGLSLHYPTKLLPCTAARDSQQSKPN